MKPMIIQNKAKKGRVFMNLTKQNENVITTQTPWQNAVAIKALNIWLANWFITWWPRYKYLVRSDFLALKLGFHLPEKFRYKNHKSVHMCRLVSLEWLETRSRCSKLFGRWSQPYVLSDYIVLLLTLCLLACTCYIVNSLNNLRFSNLVGVTVCLWINENYTIPIVWISRETWPYKQQLWVSKMKYLSYKMRWCFQ